MWSFRIPLGTALFSGYFHSASFPSGSFLNASSVGAKSVKGPLSLSVAVRSAAFSASRSDLKAGSVEAVNVSRMSFGFG